MPLSWDGMKRVNKPETYLDLGSVDIAGLRNLVLSLSEAVWAKENAIKENGFSVLRQTEHIVFRFIPENQDPRNFYANRIWDIWQQQLLPVMDRVAKIYGHREVVYPKVMLARLPAGEHISEHSDGRGSHPYTHKIHVPLVSNAQAMFTVNGSTRHLEVGQAYEVNNIARHGAENKGDEDRIHLIFEHFDCSG